MLKPVVRAKWWVAAALVVLAGWSGSQANASDFARRMGYGFSEGYNAPCDCGGSYLRQASYPAPAPCSTCGYNAGYGDCGCDMPCDGCPPPCCGRPHHGCGGFRAACGLKSPCCGWKPCGLKHCGCGMRAWSAPCGCDPCCGGGYSYGCGGCGCGCGDVMSILGN